MISFRTAEFFINQITFFLVYLVAATGANLFRTFVTSACGDDTAKEHGFFTLNPIHHIDPFGAVMLFFFQFGWPRMVPIDSTNIHAPYRRLKLFCSFFSDILMYLFLSISGIIVLLFLFNPLVLGVIEALATFDITSHLILAKLYPQASSLSVVIGYCCIILVYLSTQLAVLQVFINGAYYVTAAHPDQFEWLAHRPFMLFILFVLFAYIFSPVLRVLTISLITTVGYQIALLGSLIPKIGK
jgi:hypothetical protein